MHGTIDKPRRMFSGDMSFSEWTVGKERKKAIRAMDRAALVALTMHHPGQISPIENFAEGSEARESHKQFLAILEGAPSKAPPKTKVINRERLRREERARVRRTRRPPMSFIVNVVAARRGIEPSALYSRSRKCRVVQVRYEIFYIIKKLRPDLSLPQIGRHFGRHHTTIGYGIARHAAENNVENIVSFSVKKNRAIPRRTRWKNQYGEGAIG